VRREAPCSSTVTTKSTVARVTWEAIRRWRKTSRSSTVAYARQGRHHGRSRVDRECVGHLWGDARRNRCRQRRESQRNRRRRRGTAAGGAKPGGISAGGAKIGGGAPPVVASVGAIAANEGSTEVVGVARALDAIVAEEFAAAAEVIGERKQEAAARQT
jgi:hypothetical protein